MAGETDVCVAVAACYAVAASGSDAVLLLLAGDAVVVQLAYGDAAPSGHAAVVPAVSVTAPVALAGVALLPGGADPPPGVVAPSGPAVAAPVPWPGVVALPGAAAHRP